MLYRLAFSLIIGKLMIEEIEKREDHHMNNNKLDRNGTRFLKIVR